MPYAVTVVDYVVQVGGMTTLLDYLRFRDEAFLVESCRNLAYLATHGCVVALLKARHTHIMCISAVHMRQSLVSANAAALLMQLVAHGPSSYQAWALKAVVALSNNGMFYRLLLLFKFDCFLTWRW